MDELVRTLAVSFGTSKVARSKTQRVTDHRTCEYLAGQKCGKYGQVGYAWTAGVCKNVPTVISGFRRDVDEICALLGYYS